jgi:hypothetical protein
MAARLGRRDECRLLSPNHGPQHRPHERLRLGRIGADTPCNVTVGAHQHRATKANAIQICPVGFIAVEISAWPDAKG